MRSRFHAGAGAVSNAPPAAPRALHMSALAIAHRNRTLQIHRSFESAMKIADHTFACAYSMHAACIRRRRLHVKHRTSHITHGQFLRTPSHHIFQTKHHTSNRTNTTQHNSKHTRSLADPALQRPFKHHLRPDASSKIPDIAPQCR